MDCKRAISLIHEYFDGDLEGHAFKRLDAHLQNCPACSKHFRQMEKTEALVRSLPDAEPSDELTERIMAAVPKPKKQTVWLSWARRHPALSAAMVFLVVMLGSLFSLWDEEALVVKGDDLEPIRIQGKTVIVPEGEVLKGNLVVENGQIPGGR